jgi:hypothetical protein
VQLLLEDWHDTRRKLADTEQRMTAVLDELELTANPRSCVAAPRRHQGHQRKSHPSR